MKTIGMRSFAIITFSLLSVFSLQSFANSCSDLLASSSQLKTVEFEGRNIRVRHFDEAIANLYEVFPDGRNDLFLETTGKHARLIFRGKTLESTLDTGTGNIPLQHLNPRHRSISLRIGNLVTPLRGAIVRVTGLGPKEIAKAEALFRLNDGTLVEQPDCSGSTCIQTATKGLKQITGVKTALIGGNLSMMGALRGLIRAQEKQQSDSQVRIELITARADLNAVVRASEATDKSWIENYTSNGLVAAVETSTKLGFVTAGAWAAYKCWDFLSLAGFF